MKITIIDSGVDCRNTHVKKLQEEAKNWRRLTSRSFVDSVPSGQDLVGHGTHIAVTVMRVARWAEVYVATVVDEEGRILAPCVAKVWDHLFLANTLFIVVECLLLTKCNCLLPV